MNETSDPDSLYLGFVTLSWDQKGGLLEGLGRLIGTELGRMLNKTPVYVQYDSYSEQGTLINETGILGDVMHRKLFTAIDTSSISLERIQLTKYSLPVLYSKYVFVEGRMWNALDTSNIEFFVVFPLSTLVLIFIFTIITTLIERVEASLSHTHIHEWPTLDFVRLAIRACFLYGSFFIVAIHGARFNGNALVTNISITQMLKLLTDVKAWKRTILLKDKANYLMSTAILGDRFEDHIEVLGNRNMSAVLCSDPRYVTQVYDFDANLLAKQATRGCEMFIAANSPSVLKLLKFPELFYGTTYHLLFSKSMPSRIVERVNYMLLTLFQYDTIETYYTRRIIGSTARPVSTPSATADFSAVTLLTLWPVFQLYIGFLVVGVLIFLLEYFTYRFRHMKRSDEMMVMVKKLLL